MIKHIVLVVCCVFTVVEVGGLECTDVSNHKNIHLLPRKPFCGKSSWIRPHPVLGAGIRVSDLGEYPWLVSLQFKRKARFTKHPKWEHVKLCTGSLINDRYVISAAQCFNLSTSYIYRALAKLGDWIVTVQKRDCQESRCAPPRQLHIVTSSIRHSNFFPADNKYNNDVALLRLHQRVQFNEFVQPICLPLTCFWQAKELDCYELTVAGWGFTEERIIPSKMRVIIKEPKDCDGEDFKDSQLCTGVVPYQTNCKGDLGSPLMYQEIIRNNLTYYLLGMTSRWACTRRGVYAPFALSTKMAAFVRWILDHISD